MLTSVTIENFRNLDCLTLERLGRVTLIGGQNGSGKTALLEALFLFSGPDLPELSERVNGFRGLPPPGREHVFRSIFSEYDADKRICISAYGDWGHSPRTLDIRVQDRSGVAVIPTGSADRPTPERFKTSQLEGAYEIVFSYCNDDGAEYTSRAWWRAETLTLGGPALPIVTEGALQEVQRIPDKATSVFIPAVDRQDPQVIASRFGKFQLDGNEAIALDFIRPLEPRMQGLTLIPLNDVPVIHARLEGVNRLIPIQLLGEGLNRMFGLVLAMNEARGGLLLIDEIENGLHYSVQEEVFLSLLNLAETCDVQVFATTHSHEFLERTHRVAAKRYEKDFVYYRIGRSRGRLQSVRYDKEMFEVALSSNMEIR